VSEVLQKQQEEEEQEEAEPRGAIENSPLSPLDGAYRYRLDDRPLSCPDAGKMFDTKNNKFQKMIVTATSSFGHDHLSHNVVVRDTTIDLVGVVSRRNRTRRRE
jgi:hypothetical protein